MADQTQESKKEDKPGFSLLKPSEWREFLWNWAVRKLPVLKRYRIGRSRVGEREPPVWYELRKTWFPKNKTWFETKLQTVEDFWTAQGKHYGEGVGKDGERTLLANPDGIVNMYEELGVYADIDRLNIEVNWFEVGTGYAEINFEQGIPNNEEFWDRYGWNHEKVRAIMKNPTILKGLKLLKKIKLSSGFVYHEDKKRSVEELYCFGYTNAEALAKRISLYLDQLTTKGLQREGMPADPRNRSNEASARLVELMNAIAEIEEESFRDLDKLKGLTDTYDTKWSDQVTKLSPEAKSIAVIRYPHTYRIVKLHYVPKEDIEEEIAIRGGEAYNIEYNEEGDEKKPIPLKKYFRKRRTFIGLKQGKNIYEIEVEEIKKKMKESKELLDKRVIKIDYYNAIIKSYEERLGDIEHNIINKQQIILDTTPNISPNEFWQRPEEADYGLDENGYPLEIDPNTGEILIDKWWNEIAGNKWQLETIAKKLGGIDYLKKHLDGFQATITGPIGSPEVTILNRGSRRRRYIKDKRFHGYVDLLELGAILYSGWDAFRDDLRDGRYHKHTKSVADYVIAGEGGFDENRLAPYPKALLEIDRSRGIFIRSRGIITTSPTGINFNVHDKSVLVDATPKLFENVPENEKAVKQDYVMKLPDGSTVVGERKANKYNPAFDRRAANLDYVYWGRMYYYRWSGDINEWDENPFPHISTRGIALYIDYLVKSDVWDYKDAIRALKGHKFDYGVRGSGKYGEVNMAEGTGILQEN